MSIRIIRPNSSTQSIPMLSSIKSLIHTLFTILNFEHRNFSEVLTPHFRTRLTSLLNQACASGQLQRGLAQPRKWVGAHLMRHIMTAYLQRYLVKRSKKTDAVIQSLLAISLLYGTAARPQDLFPDQADYPGLFLQFKDIELRIVEPVLIDPTISPPPISALEATVKLHHEKGHKGVQNTPGSRVFRALRNPQDFPTCPILNLLSHCIRHDLVFGETIDEVLSDATKHKNVVQWRFPKYPIISTLSTKKPSIEFTKPLPHGAFNDILKEMGLRGGVADTITAVTIRRGAARDLSHLDQSTFTGVSTQFTGAQSGHSRGSTANGTTDIYTGSPHEFFLNARAEQSRQGHTVVYAVNGTAGAEVLNKNSSAEIAEWCNENGLDVKIPSHRVKASRAIQQEKRDKFFAEAQAEESTMDPLSDAYTQELFTDIISAVVRFCYGESQPLPASEVSETATSPATISQEDFVTWLSNVQFVRINPMEKVKSTIEEPDLELISEPASGILSITEDYKGWLKH